MAYKDPEIKRQKAAEYRESHREQLREANRQYDHVHRKEREEARRIRRARLGPGHRKAGDAAYGRRWKQQQREAIIAAMGGKCRNCGFEDWRALQIDHINGGGNVERRSTTVWAYYKKLRDMPDPTKYQLLCANCNAIKRYERGEHRKPQE